ncbi:MAG: alpha/beta hydrolase [Caulobacter sp.]|nr:alpha/beta hydrolase [Caulobacter sp.]
MASTFVIKGRTIRGVLEHSAEPAVRKVLLVFVHGWTLSPRTYRSVRALARLLFPGADQFVPSLPTGPFSLWSADRVADRLLGDLDAVAGAGGYEEIILTGHSAGAVLTRAVWLRAMGARPNGQIDATQAHPWAAKVSRIVLLAAVNRGWSPTVAVSPIMRFWMWLGAVWEFTLHTPLRAVFGTTGYIHDYRRGSPFITTMRLQWLAATRALGNRMPPVVQVLGTIDNLISPADNVDLVTGGDFYYIEAPRSDHTNVLDLEDPDRGPPREAIIRAALTGDRSSLKAMGLTSEQVLDYFSDGLDDFDEDPAASNAARALVTRVVFVTHGIRDYGYWTKKLAGRIKQRAEPGVCRTVTSSYGFFPMGPFVSKALRLRRVEWLLDQYVKARALYPDAKFAFMGHSNGTYLMAHALDICLAVKFDRVVLAGSVLPSRYRWSDRINSGQVSQVLNYVATADWVVALFPKFFGYIPTMGLGGAGFDGFHEDPPIEQVRFVKGGHSAAIREALWDHAAEFLIAGRMAALPPEARFRERRSVFAQMAWGLMSLVMVPVAVCFFLGIGYGILTWDQAPWIVALSFLAYAFVISRLLTRV